MSKLFAIRHLHSGSGLETRMRFGPTLLRSLVIVAALTTATTCASGGDPALATRFTEQGPQWDAVRAAFYRLDQGSRIMPLRWLEALKRADGVPFLDDGLARYGFLPDPGPANADRLPVGFSVAASPQGPSVGLTCAACHTREIEVAGRTWRLDGGPGFIDFQSFLADLDAAVLRVLASDKAFHAFSESVIGGDSDRVAIGDLRAAVEFWSRRFHTLVSAALPIARPWGVARLDAFGMIYNRLTALDLGAPPDDLIADNVALADAPVRYPFLWNSSLQDRTEWPGFANNGDDRLALARNLGELYGVFGIFHPKAASAGAPLDRDYLGDNSGNLRGLAELETMVRRLGPPAWPWPVDAKLAVEGKGIFDLSSSEGGCAECHGIAPGEPRGGMPTWRTPVVDVGTDTRQWTMLTRTARTGLLRGAFVPGVTAPLREIDAAANILKTAVIGALRQASHATGTTPTDEMAGVIRTPTAKTPSPKGEAPARRLGVYEARVLRGIWGAAPYLHNGSVPTLAALLQPAKERPRTFRVGRSYDIGDVGLAVEQPGLHSVLNTTGCDDRASGNSNCGHEFGTRLSSEQKKALLEYLKTL